MCYILHVLCYLIDVTWTTNSSSTFATGTDFPLSPSCISFRHTFIALFYTLPIFCDITNKVFIVFSFLGKLSFLQRLCKISLGLMVNFILFN